MAAYGGRGAIAGSMMKQGGGFGGLFGGGASPQRSPWGAGMMQGAAGGPQSGIFGGLPGAGTMGRGMPGRTSFGPGIDNFNPGGGSPYGGAMAGLTSPYAPTKPTPPPVPMATPTPTSSLGQPAAQPTLGGLGGGFGGGMAGLTQPFVPSSSAPPPTDVITKGLFGFGGGGGSMGGGTPYQLDAGTGGGQSTYSGPAFDPQQYQQQRSSLLADARAKWNPTTGIA
jgi:hypothetical protein